MALRDIFLNMLNPEAQEVQKVSNSVGKSAARDFLINGNRDKLYPTWSDIKMSDSDMYRGYSYAVIQKRANKVATLAKNNLKTWANPEIVDEYQKQNENVVHPYLKLIEDSTAFTEKQFWKNISIYLDLAGRYYLGVIRNEVKPLNPNLPTITTDPTQFIMLNPYEIRRVIDKNKNVAGYIERKKDGRYREWPAYQIIEMRELNPFDPENSQWAMTDAAKNAVYTINQSGDYTRQSLNGNIDAPGIITTDVLLNDEDFANFRARVAQHRKGEPLFGNGTGAIKWDSMQIDLDKAALMDINEINRTELFAVSGTSKTSLGIEQSGTTRETARVQSEQFVSDTAQPRLEDIVDFLNLDYKRHYTNEYKKTGYYIEVESAVGKDYDTEQKAVALKSSQFQLAQQLIQSGYTTESAYQFAEGEIDFKDLELEKGLDKPINPDEPQEPEESSPNSPNNGPRSGSDSGDDNNTASEQNSLETANNEVLGDNSVTTDLNELTPHSDLNSLEGENSLPLNKCTCGHDHKIETFINEVKEDEGKIVDKAYKDFLQEVRDIEKETIDASVRKVTVNSFEISDIIGERKRKKLTEKLKNAIHRYWWLIFPLFADNSMNKRNEEFDEDIDFVFNNALQQGVDDNADRVAKGHMETILNDILEASNRALTNVTEEAAAELIVKAYKVTPDKFSDYFDHEPTMADALSSIQKTDILEQNRKIYEKANKMAFEGYDRKSIIKAIREEYKPISENRAETIARNETSRAFTHSQFQADKQFLNAIGKLDVAYKQLVSSRPLTEQDKICPVCQALINMGPVPFEEPFLAYGESIEVQDGDKVRTFVANYESIEGGTVHVNCACRYELVFKNDAGEFVKTLNGVENGKSNNLDNSSSDSGNSSVGGDTEQAKIINGGKGSGNFGHLGRPGEVGGSSSMGAIISPMRTKAFMKGDIVELTLDDGSKIQGEFVMSAKTPAGKLMSAKDENGKVHTVPFTSNRVKMIKNYDAPDTKPSERRTKAQKEALGEVFNILTVDEKMQRYMLNNCGEDTAVALKDELKKAQEDGIDFSNVRLTQGNLGRNRAQVRTEIHSEYDGERTNYKADVQLMLSSGLVAGGKNYEASLKRQYEKGETLTPDIASVFRHEIGHIRANDLVARMTNNNYNSNDYNRLNRLITDKALNATGKTFGDVPHLVSEYGATDRSEMLAESFAQPNHSELTKAVVKAYKEFGPENWQKLTMNKNEQILKSFDLCTGIPPEQKEEFIPDEGER